MGLFDSAKAVKPAEPAQQLQVQAKPISINPRVHNVIFRQLSRLGRLYSAKNRTADMQEAIEVCLATLRVSGVKQPPRNEAEVQRFINEHNKGA